MSSNRQINANQRNATESTGPKSARGKALSRLNAVKHGLYSSSRLLPGEDRALYRTLATAIMDFFQPVGPVEETLADQILGEVWRLKRYERAERSLFERFHEGKVVRAAQRLSEGKFNLLNQIDRGENRTPILGARAEIKSNADVRGDEQATPWTQQRAKQSSLAVTRHGRDKVLETEDWDLTVLETMLPADEREPLARIERGRRTVMHVYLAYVATLKTLQDQRRLLEAQRSPETDRSSLRDDGRD